jgi:hypothetical protein
MPRNQYAMFYGPLITAALILSSGVVMLIDGQGTAFKLLNALAGANASVVLGILLEYRRIERIRDTGD